MVTVNSIATNSIATNKLKLFKTIFAGFLFGMMFVCGLSKPAFACWLDCPTSINIPMPNDPAALQGAFSGKQYVNGHSRDVTVLIHPAPMTGSLYVVLMDSDENHQHFEPEIFYAEVLQSRMVGLITLGLTSNQDRIAPKTSNANQNDSAEVIPSALMQISVDGRNRIKSINITPQDGVPFLVGPVRLEALSGDYRVLDAIAPGKYVVSDPASITIYASGSDILASANVPQLGLSNDYSLDYEMTGIAALRARAYGNYFQQRDSSKISALLIPLIVDGQAGIIVDRPGKGAIILTAKQN